MKIEPCPKCNYQSYLAIKSGIEPNSLIVECENCGFVVTLKSKLPLEPSAILKERNEIASEVKE